MSHPRTTLRDAVRAALAAAITDVDWRQDWWIKVTAAQLPRGGVGTPQEQPVRIDTGAVDRRVDLLVVIKREGDEIVEERLDADSALVETVVLPFLAGVSDDFDLTETRTGVYPEAGRPVGELSMRFRVVLRTPEGQPL